MCAYIFVANSAERSRCQHCDVQHAVLSLAFLYAAGSNRNLERLKSYLKAKRKALAYSPALQWPHFRVFRSLIPNTLVQVFLCSVFGPSWTF